MNILITSDLHFGITPKTTIADFARIASRDPMRADIVVIAGDIAEVIQNPEWFRLCLRIWRQTFKQDIPILVLAGNHDLWVRPENVRKRTSLTLWNEILPQITTEEGCIWLEEKNWVQDEIAVVGSMLHYDYSAIDKVGSFAGYSPEYFMVNKKAFGMNDGHFFHGLPSDIEFAKQIGDAFDNRLLEAQNDPQIKHITVATHVPCLECQITRNPHNKDWARSTPYFGNLSHEKIITGCSKVRYVVSGHSHRGNESVLSRGQDQDLVVWTLESDYYSPVYKICEL